MTKQEKILDKAVDLLVVACYEIYGLKPNKRAKIWREAIATTKKGFIDKAKKIV